MARGRILVVEDDDDIAELIGYNLEREGYDVKRVESGEAALDRVAKERPDLVLLDLMLPKLDGLEVCRRLKAGAQTRDLPVVMVTAKGEESDVVAGLELGAEDYITKPFRARELVARVRAVLRRGTQPEPADNEPVALHDIAIDPLRREVRVGGRVADLTSSEFRILHFLARHPGWVFSRYQIVDAVHGENYPVTDRSVDVQVMGLRRKLGKASRHIETVRGFGYRMKEEES
jgi:two-component system alkaline phosphatase synthesis response regulator PhoP